MPKLPMTARETLDRCFLPMRHQILEIAAALDRIDRAEGASVAADPRRQNLARAIEILNDAEPGRAERIQMLFSRDYHSHWLDGFDGADIFKDASRNGSH